MRLSHPDLQHTFLSSRWSIILLLPTLICLLLATLLAATVSAESQAPAPQASPTPSAALVVDTLADENDGSCSDGDCSLRDAVALVSTGGTISFDAVITTITLTDQMTLTRDMTIDGGDTVTLDGNGASRHFRIIGGSVILQNISLQNGNPENTTNGVQDNGGSLEIGVGATVVITNSQLLSNTVAESDEGAAIYSQGDLTIYNSVIAFNRVTEEKSHAVYSFGGSLALYKSSITDNSAGGIFNFNAATETVISNSTIANNEHNASGGGISNIGSQLVIVNSTISGNTSRSNSASFGGGGLYNGLHTTFNSDFQPLTTTIGTVTITNSTFADNTNSMSHINNWGGDVTVFNSTFAGGSGLGIVNSTPRDVDDNSVFPPVTVETITSTTTLHNAIVTDNALSDCGGTVTAGSDNLASDATCDAATESAEINLAPLADNDCVMPHATLNGSACVQTMALQVGSAAIENAASNVATATLTDQRGAAVDGARRDTGAYENKTCFGFASRMRVGTQMQLAAAIDCYNTLSTASSYTISITSDISLTANTPTINNATAGVGLQITGNGNTLDGQGVVRSGFTIDADTNVSIDQLTMINGDVSGEAGAIFNDGGNVTITDSTLANNRASFGGAISSSGGTLTIDNSTLRDNVATAFDGGAIYSTAPLTLTNSSLISNTTTYSGGGLSSSATTLISNTTIMSNTAALPSGGGIYASGSITIRDSRIEGNRVVNPGSGAEGGGIASFGALVLENSVVRGNAAVNANDQSQGGGVYLGASSSAVIVGTEIVENSAEFGGGIYNRNTLTLTNSTVSENVAESGGAGLFLLAGTTEINNTQIISNTSESGAGGGIANDSLDPNTPSGTLIIRTSDVSGNTVAIDGYFGGGIYNYNGDVTLIDSDVNNNSASVTGGIYSIGNTDVPASLTILRSTVADNAGSTGGIENRAGSTAYVSDSTISSNLGSTSGGLQNFGTATLTNTTVSGNRAGPVARDDSARGGGVAVGGIFNFRVLTLTHVTIVGNAAADDGCCKDEFVGGLAAFNGTVTVRNSLIAENTASTDNPSYSEYPGCLIASRATYIASGDSVADDVECSDFTIVADVQVDALADNGGSTQTHALRVASPAIDLGDSASCAATDQRGVARDALNCDAGAFELTDCERLAQDAPYGVDSAETLDAAIICYNTLSTAGTYAISLTNNISLTTALTPIDNTTGGVALALNGNGFAIDGQNSARVLTIAADTTVAIEGVAVINGNDESSGGIHNDGTATINNSRVNGNSGSGTIGAGGIYNNGVMTVTNSTFSGNSGSGTSGSGGILNGSSGLLTVRNTLFDGNSAARGGGIANLTGGILNVAGSLFTNNVASDQGGALYTYTGGTLTVDDSTFTGNSGRSGAAVSNAGLTTIRNSTLHGNIGRAIQTSFQTMTLTHVTIDSNRVAGIRVSSGSLIMQNSIVANSLNAGGTASAANCIFTQSSNPSLSDLDSSNLATDATCGDSTQADDALLTPLADNGSGVQAGSSVSGSTPITVQTQALQAASPAIDLGDSATCIATDQRGVARPTDGNGDSIALCDAGALEAPAIPVANFYIDDTQVVEGDSGTVELTFTITRSSSVLTSTVVVSTTDGTATDGVDYVGRTQTITFPIGTTTQPFTVTVSGDTDIEPDETLTATLSNVTNGVIEGDNAVGTIVNDDDDAPTVINTSPVTGAVNVTIASSISITFSEAVSVTSGVTLTCDGAAQSIALAMSGPTVLDITPESDLPSGETCTLTVPADSVQDDDAIDPPDGLSADFTLTFTTAIADPTASTTLLITAFTYQADTSDGVPDGNLDGFIIIKNISADSISLDGYKLGDEEKRGGDEGMFALPNVMLGAGDSLIIAENADEYAPSTPADYSFAANSAGVPTLTAYSAWASGAVDLDNVSDEVVLLSPTDDLVDGACYGSVGTPCLFDTTARAQTRILNDGRLADDDNFAGFARHDDVDTNTRTDWELQQTAVGLVGISAETPPTLLILLSALLLLTVWQAAYRRHLLTSQNVPCAAPTTNPFENPQRQQLFNIPIRLCLRKFRQRDVLAARDRPICADELHSAFLSLVELQGE